jgi:hypothetical protein
MSKQDDKLIEKLNEISEKLDILTILYAGKENFIKLLEKKNQTEQIQTLRKWKLSNEVIAIIMGTTPDVVGVRISEMKSPKNSKQKKGVKENEQGTEGTPKKA